MQVVIKLSAAVLNNTKSILNNTKSVRLLGSVLGMNADAAEEALASLTIPVPVGTAATEVEFLIKHFANASIPAKAVQVDSNGKEVHDLTADESDYVAFGDVCRERCGMQAQYGSEYLLPKKDRLSLAADIRLRGRGGSEFDAADYHDIEIHKDDVDIFVERVLAYKTAIHNISIESADVLRKRGMLGKTFLVGKGVLDGAKAYDVAEALMSDRERESDGEGGAGLLRRLTQLRPGEHMAFNNGGTFIRLANK